MSTSIYTFNVISGKKFTVYTNKIEENEEDCQLDNRIPNKQFLDDCDQGDLNTLKNRYDLNLLDKEDIDEAFWESCENGNLEVAKWLYASGKLDFSDGDYDFCGVCDQGQLEIAQWVYSLGDFKPYGPVVTKPIGSF